MYRVGLEYLGTQDRDREEVTLSASERAEIDRRLARMDVDSVSRFKSDVFQLSEF